MLICGFLLYFDQLNGQLHLSTNVSNLIKEKKNNKVQRNIWKQKNQNETHHEKDEQKSKEKKTNTESIRNQIPDDGPSDGVCVDFLVWCLLQIVRI